MIIYDNTQDTIVAIASANGKGAIAIVRLSGKGSLQIANAIFEGSQLKNRMLAYGYIVDGDKKIDQVNIVYMQAPKTYTGQDIIEIYCHGSIFVAKNIVNVAIGNGARLALPGEYTKRAFLNGKIDLSQAEAVADIINATTQSANDTALNQLSGRLRQSMYTLMDMLTKCIAHIEVTVDYPHEDIEDTTIQSSLATVNKVLAYVDKAIVQSERGKIYRTGIRCAIIGQPNVGKSSLLNAILGESRAIVTSIAGTTRDTLEAHIDISGIEVIITDTAGIRKGTNDVEVIGVERAYDAASNAHIVLYVLDMSQEISDEDITLYNHIKHTPHLIVLNKGDITIKNYDNQLNKLKCNEKIIRISALKNIGISALEDEIVSLINDKDYVLPSETELSNLRHIRAITKAKESLLIAKETLTKNMPVDLAVVDIKDALYALGEITGDNVDEDVINTIFSEFCVGK